MHRRCDVKAAFLQGVAFPEREAPIYMHLNPWLQGVLQDLLEKEQVAGELSTELVPGRKTLHFQS